jgi:hypothetical protein
MGYAVHGTLGIILGAWRQRRRSRKRVLYLLQAIPSRSTLHLSKALLAAAIEDVQGIGS